MDNKNTYRIVFRANGYEKTSTLTVDKLTFAEAVQEAFRERNKLGFEYRIVSIRDIGV
tara:strand:+ start:143 stop:316 length:174 start_codon:yes stop_codon:yes gene_type:complete